MQIGPVRSNLIEQEPPTPAIVPQWPIDLADQWQPAVSALVVDQLRQLSPVRTGQVFQSLGQVSRVTFQDAAGNITASQTVHQVVGWEENGVLKLTRPGQNVVQIVTSVQLF